MTSEVSSCYRSLLSPPCRLIKSSLLNLSLCSLDKIVFPCDRLEIDVRLLLCILVSCYSSSSLYLFTTISFSCHVSINYFSPYFLEMADLLVRFRLNSLLQGLAMMPAEEIAKRSVLDRAPISVSFPFCCDCREKDDHFVFIRSKQRSHFVSECLFSSLSPLLVTCHRKRRDFFIVEWFPFLRLMICWLRVNSSSGGTAASSSFS